MTALIAYKRKSSFRKGFGVVEQITEIKWAYRDDYMQSTRKQDIEENNAWIINS